VTANHDLQLRYVGQRKRAYPSAACRLLFTAALQDFVNLLEKFEDERRASRLLTLSIRTHTTSLSRVFTTASLYNSKFF